MHFIGIGLGFRAQPTITSSWNWLENDCLTPVVHISIMLLRPVKWGAKCTTEPTNKQSNDECDAQVNIGNGRNLPKLLLIQSIIYEQTLWALPDIVKKEYWHIQNQMSQHFRFKKKRLYTYQPVVCVTSVVLIGTPVWCDRFTFEPYLIFLKTWLTNVTCSPTHQFILHRFLHLWLCPWFVHQVDCESINSGNSLSCLKDTLVKYLEDCLKCLLYFGNALCNV